MKSKKPIIAAVVLVVVAVVLFGVYSLQSQRQKKAVKK